MNTIIFSNYDAMCKQIADEIQEDLKKNPKQMLCIAAGTTSLGVFKHLIERYNNGEIDFSQAYFVAMDEWLHMNETTPDSCGNFLVREFLNYVNYAPSHVYLWNGCNEDPEEECRIAENFIRENSDREVIDYLVLGMGMNGHLALNEPGVDLHDTAHICVLDTVTQKVGQKYFQEGAALTGGITLGIENFRQSARTVLMVDGQHKAGIVQKVLGAPEVTNMLPATAVREFPNASFYCDEAAASEVSR